MRTIDPVASAPRTRGGCAAAGAALATDARGIAVEAAHLLAAGEIFRVFQSARATGPVADA